MAKCTSCGEKEATTKIPDPNGGLEYWDVCEDCAKYIPEMQEMSAKLFISDL